MVLLVGIVAYRIQRPRLMAAVVTAQAVHDSMAAHITMLGSLSHQDTAVLRDRVRSNAHEIAMAEERIPESVNTPALMLTVDTLTHRYHLTSGPLTPDSMSLDQPEANAVPYGIEAFDVTVTGSWGDIVAFIKALPEHPGPVMVIPAVRGLVRAHTGERSLTADVALMIVTRHPRSPLPLGNMGQASSATGNAGPTPPVGISASMLSGG